MLLKRPLLVFLFLATFSAPLAAEAPPGLEALPAPTPPPRGLEEPAPAPPPPEMVEHDEELQPEITIIQREDATVEEYRVNGVLYTIKVTPKVGKPYYFVDRDGDGVMDSRMSDLYNPFKVPQWVIFSW